MAVDGFSVFAKGQSAFSGAVLPECPDILALNGKAAHLFPSVIAEKLFAVALYNSLAAVREVCVKVSVRNTEHVRGRTYAIIITYRDGNQKIRTLIQDKFSFLLPGHGVYLPVVAVREPYARDIKYSIIQAGDVLGGGGVISSGILSGAASVMLVQQVAGCSQPQQEHHAHYFRYPFHTHCFCQRKEEIPDRRFYFATQRGCFATFIQILGIVIKSHYFCGRK